MDKKSQEELEKPAKVYQVDALHNEVVAVKRLLEDQNSMLKGAISAPYLEERLKNLNSEFEAKLKAMKAKYDPVLGNAKWAARTAIGAFIIIVVGYLIGVSK